MNRLWASRADAIDAVTVLDRIIGEVMTGAHAVRWFRLHGLSDAQVLDLLERMCLAHMVFACCKFVEFYQHFHHVLEDEERRRAKRLIRQIGERGIIEFRNRFVGHVWDKEQRRILLDSEARR